jgi:RNA polymerase sigma-70 factor (ECF subfamily)
MAEFEALYRAHVQSVFRFALRAVSNRALAEDLTADAFLELYRHRDSIDESRLPAWLVTVVRNRARDHWRRQEVEHRHADAVVQASVTSAAAAATGMTVADGLERWILEAPELKDVHRTCLMLRYVEGMSRAEIAETLGLGEMQVKSYLQYALVLLRKKHDEPARR